ncbi:DUF4255 domain-containing protein [Streptomyces paludis]|uniref:DUF4255 domain-containing protein n=1 Tax=Streptomyces paludis TaxID=2282738 RepID=A0A345HLJ7_9ACTN|nr:DUF4255 domain-containing protein [Streptomyces paludis]AXG77571.1 DUF4255 domain-containing protein [Streptomyces paludis]
MIHEVDDILRGLLTRGAFAGSDVEVVFDAPTRDWAARRNAPTIDAYLYDIREDTTRRQRGAVSVRDERGIAVHQRQPPRWFRLAYLVTAWTKRPQDEHRMLSAVLHTLLPWEILPPEVLTGSLAGLKLSIPLSVSGTHTEARSLADIWSALNGELKPSLDVVITAPLLASPEYRVGPPVTEGLGVQIRGRGGAPDDSPTHYLSPEALAAAKEDFVRRNGTSGAVPEQRK